MRIRIRGVTRLEWAVIGTGLTGFVSMALGIMVMIILNTGWGWLGVLLSMPFFGLHNYLAGKLARRWERESS